MTDFSKPDDPDGNRPQPNRPQPNQPPPNQPPPNQPPQNPAGGGYGYPPPPGQYGSPGLPPAPGYNEPQQPAYQQPAYQQPSYPQPGYQQPGYPQPGYQQPEYPQQPGYPPAGYPAAPPPGYPPQNYGYGGGYPGGLALPPGVELASHGRRVGAFFLAIPLSIITLGIGYAIWGLVLWGRGTSPALKVLGMRCLDSNTGQPVGFGKMALRDLVGYILQAILSIITYIASFVMFLATDKRQSLPDMVASTIVVYDPNKVLG